MQEHGPDLYRLQTGYFPGQSGDLHLSAFLPACATPSCWVIHVPAFAEEMNKSRAVVAAQAMSLAGQGVAVLVPDLFGTGDSEGSFVEARWQTWKEDLHCLARWVREQGGSRLVLWGHRLGALLAAEVAAGMPEPPQQLVLWQPIHSGKQQMTQFLRLRMAASLTDREAGSETVATLREGLVEGQSVRIAGYDLAGGLYAEIETRQLSSVALPLEMPVAVLEVTSRPGASVTPVTQKQLSQWQQQGHSCHGVAVSGDPFWATQELGSAPALIDETTAAILDLLRAADLTPSPEAIESHQASPLPGFRSASRHGFEAVTFNCGDSQLAGVLHAPETEVRDIAVLVIVGGPQYRIGSHRQFVHLAQSLASAGIPVLRFDYRGMGDSGGNFTGFVTTGPDIRSAVEQLLRSFPSVRGVVLWGLCDAATAAMFHAPGDQRVVGLALANPWVYSEQGAAKAYLKHYYLRRVVSRAFWSKVFSGAFSPRKSLSSAFRFTRQAWYHRKGSAASEAALKTPEVDSDRQSDLKSARGDADLVARFAQSLARFQGPVLLVLSGKDLTAAEFIDAGKDHPGLRKALAKPNVQQLRVPGMDHTFSRVAWRQQVEQGTIEFILSRCSRG